MKQQKNLVYENHILKNKLQDFYNTFGKCPIIDDKVLKGSVRVVKTIEERDKIPACYRKQGMKVIVVGKDLSFKEYILKTDNCKKNTWEEINVTAKENEVYLIEDYSELSENLTTQKELNLILKQLILNLQTQIDNIELTDEKVQITEATNFAQIGQTQKDFNKNVSDYKTNSDLKNQEQDDRLTNIEGINYTWSPTNRTLTLYDNNGNQLSQVSLVSLDNEGTDLRYNSVNKSLELYNADNELIDSIPVLDFVGNVASALQLNSNNLQLRDSQGNVLSSVNFSVSNISGLQTALDAQTQALNTEITNRTNADNALQGQINTNAGAISAEVTARANADALKLDKPTASITAVDATWRYIPVIDSTGNSRQILTTDLLKNIGNTDLTLTSARTLSQGAYTYVHSTGGHAYNITGLPDKSADTSFNTMLTQNSSGQVAKSNGKNLLKGMPATFTDAEKTAWKTEMNGGWTTATMSVAIISPPVVDRRNQPYWINLKGTNLNLPPTSFKIELCTGESSSATTANVVIEIPASQIQLYSNGLDLTFYYNFKDIPEGTYKLRLWNGVAYYLTSFTLNVVTEINSVDLNNIVWSRKIYNNATSPAITESGSSVSYSSDSSVKPFADDSSFVAARMTNELVGANEDFYMTVEITGGTGAIFNVQGTMTHFIGLVNSGTTVDLLNQTVVSIKARQTYWYPMTKLYPDNSTTSLNVNDNTYGLTAIFVRRGGNWTIIITYNNQTLLYTKTGYTGAIAFGMYNQNTLASTGVSVNIVELYKF